MWVTAPDGARLHVLDQGKGDPILWLQAGDSGDLVCSGNGRSFVLPANPGVVALLQRLNTGAPCRVGDLVREFDGPATDVRRLLEKLDTLRALAVDG